MSKESEPAKPANRVAAMGAAECEGTLVGALAAGESPVAAAGLGAAVVGSEEPAALETLARTLQSQLGEGRLAFRLSLPDDSNALDLRIEALAAWARGFLSGIGQAGARLPSADAEVAEMLSDLDAIARGAAVTEGGSEAEERAYAELIEYVRLAAQSLFEAMNPPPRRTTRGKMKS